MHAGISSGTSGRNPGTYFLSMGMLSTKQVEISAWKPCRLSSPISPHARSYGVPQACWRSFCWKMTRDVRIYRLCFAILANPLAPLTFLQLYKYLLSTLRYNIINTWSSVKRKVGTFDPINASIEVKPELEIPYHDPSLPTTVSWFVLSPTSAGGNMPAFFYSNQLYSSNRRAGV